LRTALAEIGKVLAVKLPRKEEAQDELPNDVVEE
jgi:uncharacterized membrane protein